ncbi:RagB/SusD family nutrient uptake outer membrane protein [Chitinophaga sp. XS-30]|uniref:RagB/SusD family nutrient uptake outer membrane protein n=1 Tax=Chitinophaga sp. XS-30 TaxID=2604421 RepID=UPI0011DDE4B2|nr:RagB/SusD family nutrient uptake outer membrane protein [Chitinophaga sp. XS-30]QEH40097.1 RagB/SusD family nutrient uptake outer membrane protein [Chitinophaga sp. XS-30]
MRTIITSTIIAAALFAFTGCEKYLDNTKLPAGTIAGTDAYVSDNSVSAIVTGNFLSLTGSGVFSGATGSNIPYLTGLYTDELMPIATSNTTSLAFYANSITSANTSHWSNIYAKIFAVNATIEGIRSTSAVLYNKNQWLGESLFLRAFLYFYLVNLYGDAPLVLTTDYRTNGSMPRTPVNLVYAQIVQDLKDAEAMLSTGYRDGYGTATTHRVRPNKGAATAFLAKVYLYMKEWENAEIAATAVLTDPAYKLSPLSEVFLANNGINKETIWAIANKNDEKAFEYGFYNNAMPPVITNAPSSYLVLVAFNNTMLDAFETNDGRFSTWVRSTEYTGVTPAVTYHFPNKFRSNAAGAERAIFLRKAELFLIRAEARAQQSNIGGAQADLDSVRIRAGLLPTTAATQPGLLTAILKERKVELFTEFANRFFDLKRSGTIDAVMAAAAPLKDATWNSDKQLFPIPENDLLLNPSLTPNPGY